jgi:carboxyl-terminal processing protease
VLAVLMLGTMLGQSPHDPYPHFAVFSEVVGKIKGEYVEEPDMKNVALGALNGLLESIDPFASYLNADQYKTYLKTVEAKKAGVGLILSRRFGYISVVDAIPGSPADKQSLGTGDILETLKGISTRDMPLAYAEMLLMGEPGTSVDMAVLRVRRGTEAQKISLVRAPSVAPPVTAKMMPDGIGYLQVQSLETGKSREVATKIAELQKQGAKKLLLDLRHNASGSVEEGVTLANLFLEKGLITYTQGQKSPRKDYQAEASKAVWKTTLGVLVNRGTAGGAEVAAAALQDNKRAELVGERSYGDAAQRKALTMDDGSAVILAVAKFYTPSGKSIPDNAVTPNLAVAEAADSDDDNDEPPPAATAPKKPEEDLQLKKAVEVLTVGLAAAKSTSGPQPAAAPKQDGTPMRPLNIPGPKQ